MKVSIISFPRYDDKTDSFVDGTLPSTCDSFFDNGDKMKQFFEIKESTPKHGHGSIKDNDNVSHH